MKTIVICTTLEEECLNNLKHLKNELDLTNSQIHIITIVKIQLYNFDLTPYIYPTENQYIEIENSAIEIMKGLGDSLGVASKEIIYKCYFEYDVKTKARYYLEKAAADLVIVSTRGKHGVKGLFSSSFADYLCKFSPCDILVMRPRAQLI